MEPTVSTGGGSNRPRWVGLLVVTAVLAGVAALVVAGGRGGDRSSARWDERIVDLVAYVEEERDLDFEHPVTTHFLSTEEFRAEVTDEEMLSVEEATELDHYEGLFRALGLAEGELDLRAAANQLSGEGVVGLYDPERDRILVRGGRITPAMRPTIVHELTHALQAQHFGLDLERDTSGEDLAFRALVEADALRIERAYVASLPEDQRGAVEEAQREQARAVDLKGVPQILTELFSLPYVFGAPFLEAVESEGGPAAIDRAFRRPPTTEKHLIEPTSFLEGEQPADVDAPTLRAGEEAVDEADDFGMLSMLLVLGERVPFPHAWAAVDGWAGDASVTYTADGRDCIRIRTQLDSGGDAEELLAATERWVGDRTTARTSRQGSIVVLASCDPGTVITSPDADRPRTFELLQLRIELITSLQTNGLPHEVSVCVADVVLRDTDPAQLLEVNSISDPGDPRLVALQRQVVATVERCSSGD